MTRRSLGIFALALAGLFIWRDSLCAGTTNSAPDFKEVYQLLRDNLPGATDESLNRAAVEGLLAQFPGKVSLVSATGDPATSAAISKSAVLENNVAYLHVGDVPENLADQLNSTYRALTSTNKTIGVVLDLRFANGNAFPSVAASAKAIKSRFSPLTILINGETRGAAETLAAALREAKAGLLIGSATAGEAATFKELPLGNGQRLRIATAPEKSSVSSTARVQPDILVAVNADDERAYFADAYAELMKPEKTARTKETNSFLSFIDRTSEADLVRAKIKDGDEGKNPLPPKPIEPPKPFIHDPALARAVDLIKALAVVHPSHA
ncbi:MAG: S41 family peptidase [Limisphaerales bacterium]